MEKILNDEISALNQRYSDLEKKVTGLEKILCAGKEYLTLEEAALFMGCTRSMLYKMTHLHTIPFYKPSNKMVYFEKAELVNWMKQNREMSESEIDEAAKRIIQNLNEK